MESVTQIRRPEECMKIDGHLLLACLSSTERRWIYLRVSSDATVEVVLQFFRTNFLGWPYSMSPALEYDKAFFTMSRGRKVSLMNSERFPLNATFNEFVTPGMSVVAVELVTYAPSGFKIEKDSKNLFPLESPEGMSTRIKQLSQEETVKQDEESWKDLGITLLREDSSPIKKDEGEKILYFGPRMRYYGETGYPKEPMQIKVKSETTVENVLQFFRRYCFRWPSGICAQGTKSAFLLSKKIKEIVPDEETILDIKLLKDEGGEPLPTSLAPYFSSLEIEQLFAIKSQVDNKIESPGGCVIA